MKFAHQLLAIVALAGASASFAAQPHMEEALNHLQKARNALEQASSDKGGNRVTAIKSVEQAISDVKAGIAYDKANASPEEKKK